ETNPVQDVTLAVERIDIVDIKQRFGAGGGLARSRGNRAGPGTDVDFLDLLAGARIVDRAVEQHTSLVHDSDVVGVLENPVDVVSDEQNRKIGRYSFDNGADAFPLRCGKACKRFVQ